MATYTEMDIWINDFQLTEIESLKYGSFDPREYQGVFYGHIWFVINAKGLPTAEGTYQIRFKASGTNQIQIFYADYRYY